MAALTQKFIIKHKKKVTIIGRNNKQQQSVNFSLVVDSAHGTTTVSFINDTKKMGIQVLPESNFLQGKPTTNALQRCVNTFHRAKEI